MFTPHGPGSEIVFTIQGPVGFAESGLVPHRVLAGMDDLRLAVAVDVLQQRLFVADDAVGRLHDDDESQRRFSPLGFTNSVPVPLPALPLIFRMSAHPSPVKSWASWTIAGCGYSVVGLNVAP